MPVQSGIHWITPPAALADAIELYGERALLAVTALAGRIATIMQNGARANASWADRTGDARGGLFGTAEREAAEKMVVIYLSHAPDLVYPMWLELANGGKYAIIMRTIEAHLPELQSELNALFQG